MALKVHKLLDIHPERTTRALHGLALATVVSL